MGDPVKLLLHLEYLFSPGADRQVAAGPGGGDTADLRRAVNVNGVAVIMAQDLNS